MKNMNLIKDKKLIHSEKTHSSGRKEYVLKKGTKLGQAFNFLPAGIIDKTQTGIGGTSCELDSNRASIIVQPYVFTARNKTLEPTITNKFNVFFYGSGHAGESKKNTTGKLNTKNVIAQGEKAINNELLVYLERCKESNQSPKITCVADQLFSLQQCLDTSGKIAFKEFHLVLDEIDSLQEQSTFRDAMEVSYLIYKAHPKTKRTVISATIHKFHDPVMSKEPVTEISEYGRVVENLTVVQTTDIENELIKQLEVYLARYKKDKIVVAYNNIKQCQNVVEALISLGVINKNEVKILCSVTRKASVKPYFSEVNPNGTMPAKLNFITAAYFNGFDLSEKYHSIIVTDSTYPNLRLSPSVIFQISGRCRPGLISNKLLVKIVPVTNYEIYSDKDLLEHAKDFVEVEKLYSILALSKNKLSNSSADAIRNLFINGTSEYPSVTGLDDTGKLTISYLKIDSRIEQQKTFKLYQDLRLFKNALMLKFKLSTENPSHISKSASKKIKVDSLAQGTILVKQIQTIQNQVNYYDLLNDLSIDLSANFKDTGDLIINIYKSARYLENIDINKLRNEVLTSLNVATPKSKLSTLNRHLYFQRLFKSDPDLLLQLETKFPVGNKLTIVQYKKHCRAFTSLLRKYGKSKDKLFQSAARALSKNEKQVGATLLKLQDQKISRSNNTRFKVIQSYLPFDIYHEKLSDNS
jgi:hypothetical protein